jgi:hypothetical protein
MTKVFESVSEPANLLDDEVYGLCTAVADAMGVKVART